MKKLFSFIILLVMASSISFAQPKFGFKGGLNISSMKFSQTSGGNTASFEPDSKMGFYGGLSVDNYPNPYLGISVSGIFIQRGYEVSSSGDKLAVTASYIELPVFFRYRIKPVEEGSSLFLTGGVRPAFLFSAEAELTGRYSDSKDVSDEFESFHIGLGFGAGIEIVSGNMTIIPEASYNFGLTNVAKTTSGDAKANFTDILVGIGFRFN